MVCALSSMSSTGEALLAGADTTGVRSFAGLEGDGGGGEGDGEGDGGEGEGGRGVGGGASVHLGLDLPGAVGRVLLHGGHGDVVRRDAQLFGEGGLVGSRRGGARGGGGVVRVSRDLEVEGDRVLNGRAVGGHKLLLGGRGLLGRDRARGEVQDVRDTRWRLLCE